MTAYPSDFFDGATGILEHLIIAVVAQKMANRDYIPSSLETDFTTNAIDWYIQSDQLSDSESVDNNNSLNSATLQINITLPIISYDLSVLRQIDPDISRRVASINPVNISGIGVSKEDTYDQKSFPAKYPEYLLDFTSDNYQLINTLERRIMNLCLQVLGYCRWIDRYNKIIDQLYPWYLVSLGGYAAPIIGPSEGELEAERDLLIAELTDINPLSINLPSVITYEYEKGATTEDSGSASGQGDSFGGTDPSTSTELSKGLLDLLSNSSNDFGAASDSPQSTGNDPTPTLSDC